MWWAKLAAISKQRVPSPSLLRLLLTFCHYCAQQIICRVTSSSFNSRKPPNMENGCIQTLWKAPSAHWKLGQENRWGDLCRGKRGAGRDFVPAEMNCSTSSWCHMKQTTKKQLYWASKLGLDPDSLKAAYPSYLGQRLTQKLSFQLKKQFKSCLNSTSSTFFKFWLHYILWQISEFFNASGILRDESYISHYWNLYNHHFQLINFLISLKQVGLIVKLSACSVGYDHTRTPPLLLLVSVSPRWAGYLLLLNNKQNWDAPR